MNLMNNSLLLDRKMPTVILPVRNIFSVKYLVSIPQLDPCRRVAPVKNEAFEITPQ